MTLKVIKSSLEAEEILKFEEELAVAEGVFGGVLTVVWIGIREFEVVVLVSGAEVKNCKRIWSVTDEGVNIKIFIERIIFSNHS